MNRLLGTAAVLAGLSLLTLSSRAATSDRVASVYLSQDFINEQLAAANAKPGLLQKLRISLDPENQNIVLGGEVQVPIEELRAVNLDPSLGSYRFQVAIKPETTTEGHLILEFPLAKTFFYPSSSTDPENERVIIPVQMLSVALASARGYLAALSGDFSGFDRRTKKFQAEIRKLTHDISVEKDPGTLEALKTQRESVKLSLAAVPVERKQLSAVSKQVEHVLGFTGEKELNLNNELGARKNALILKIKLSQLTPYLKGSELGGVRILHDKKDGGGANYLAIDMNSELAKPDPPPPSTAPPNRAAMKTPPALIVRLKQTLFETKALVEAEQKQLGSKIPALALRLEDDGLHVQGVWRGFWFFKIPFETVVDFVTAGTDVFEVSMRELNVGGIDLEFLSKRVLETVKNRLETTLRGICSFEYIDRAGAAGKALRVTVAPQKLVPAFPDLHLVAVDVRHREFLLKVGQP